MNNTFQNDNSQIVCESAKILCPACGNQMSRWPLSGFAAATRCPQCGLGYTPAEEVYDAKTAHTHAYSRPDALTRFKVRALTGEARPGRLLDVGCNRGEFLDAAREIGFEPYGVELAPEAARHASDTLRLHVVNGSFPDDAPPGLFDAITFWHSLEHLPDPQAALAWCARNMNPDSVLLVAAPNLASVQARVFGALWFHMDPPRHRWHFTHEAFRLLLDKCGFELHTTRHFVPLHNKAGWLFSVTIRLFGDLDFLKCSISRKLRSPRYWAFQALRLSGAPVFALAAGLESIAQRGGTFLVAARKK